MHTKITEARVRVGQNGTGLDKENGKGERKVCLPQRSILRSMPAAPSDSPPTMYVVHGRANPVLHGPNSTEPNLFHHEETTYRVG